MKLRAYLDERKEKIKPFAERIGVKRDRIYRILSDGAIPDRETMSKIFVGTNGNVMPNDFYELPALTKPSRPGPDLWHRPIGERWRR